MTKAERRKRDDEARELFLSKWSLPATEDGLQGGELAEALCPWVGGAFAITRGAPSRTRGSRTRRGPAAGDAAGAVGQRGCGA